MQTINDDAPKATEDQQKEEKEEDKPDINEAAGPAPQPAASEVAKDTAAGVWTLQPSHLHTVLCSRRISACLLLFTID